MALKFLKLWWCLSYRYGTNNECSNKKFMRLLSCLVCSHTPRVTTPKKLDQEMASPATNSSTAGYKYMFITEHEDVLKCLICKKLANDPKQHEECGKLFCEKCIEKHGKDNPCPHCRMKRPLYFKDNRSELPYK